MCLLLIALKSHPTYKLVIAVNRDEYYDRPSAHASFWAESPELLAGKDLRAGGTWLGITRNGRIGAITNYRDPASIKKDAPSRGRLVSSFLLGQQSPVDYLNGLARKGDVYNGFNLIVGVKEELYWYSNRGQVIRNLTPGIYGVSNHLLDTPWPKVSSGKSAMERLLSVEKDPTPEAFFNILSDRFIPDDKALPDTGVGLEWERLLSPIFITSPSYGTRSSTILFIDLNNHVTFAEKNFNADPNHATTIKYEFTIER